VLNQLWRQSCTNYRCSLRFVDYTLLLGGLEQWLDRLQEVNRHAASLMSIGNVAADSRLGIVINQKTHVLEFMAEDW
jgi:hypothetical protein